MKAVSDHGELSLCIDILSLQFNALSGTMPSQLGKLTLLGKSKLSIINMNSVDQVFFQRW
jgi:hypothetical protein